MEQGWHLRIALQMQLPGPIPSLSRPLPFSFSSPRRWCGALAAGIGLSPWLLVRPAWPDFAGPCVGQPLLEKDGPAYLISGHVPAKPPRASRCADAGVSRANAAVPVAALRCHCIGSRGHRFGGLISVPVRDGVWYSGAVVALDAAPSAVEEADSEGCCRSRSPESPSRSLSVTSRVAVPGLF